MALPRTLGTVADRENVRVFRRLQGRKHQELIGAVRLESVQVLQELRRLDAGRPDDQFGRNNIAAGECYAARTNFRYPCVRSHFNAKLIQQLMHFLRDAGRKRRQDSIRCFDEHDADVSLRVYAIKPISQDFAHGLVQVRRKLGPSSTGANYGYIELARSDPFWLSVSPDAGVDQPLVKTNRLLERLERDGMLLDTRCPEIVGDAADGDDQCIIVKRTAQA